MAVASHFASPRPGWLIAALLLAALFASGPASAAPADDLASGKAWVAAGDYKQAAKFLESACKAREYAACSQLSFILSEGKGVKPDLPRGIELARTACTAGDALGCGLLGYGYERGEGVAADPATGASLYQKACDGNSLNYCVNLGRMFEEGRGVAANASTAAALYTKACIGGKARGCASLGDAWRDGRGVAQDRATANALYDKACDLGLDIGCQRLTALNTPATPPNDPDYEAGAAARKAGNMAEAVARFKTACDRQNLEACADLGQIYINGEGVPRDYSLATPQTTKACAGDYPFGCLLLGLQNLEGWGVPVNGYKARKLLQLGCDGGQSQGCTFLKEQSSKICSDETHKAACPGFAWNQFATALPLTKMPLPEKGPGKYRITCKIEACQRASLPGGPLRLEEVKEAAPLVFATASLQDWQRRVIMCGAATYFAIYSPFPDPARFPAATGMTDKMIGDLSRQARKSETEAVKAWLMSGQLTVAEWTAAARQCSFESSVDGRWDWNLKLNLGIWKDEAACARTNCQIDPAYQETNFALTCANALDLIGDADMGGSGIRRTMSEILARRFGESAVVVADTIHRDQYLYRAKIANYSMADEIAAEVIGQCSRKYGIPVQPDLMAVLNQSRDHHDAEVNSAAALSDSMAAQKKAEQDKIDAIDTADREMRTEGCKNLKANYDRINRNMSVFDPAQRKQRDEALAALHAACGDVMR